MSRPAARVARDDSDDDDQPSGASRPAAVYRTDPKADQLVKDATKKMAPSLFSAFSGNSKYEDAIEMLEKAASSYKLNKNWREAGDVYAKCAEVTTTNLKDPQSAGTHWENAAKAYKNVDSKRALECYQLAVDIHMENNKFSMGAKLWKEMGLLCEKEHNLKGALHMYQKAADCYEADNAAANAASMFIKVADLAADAEDYQKAISIYEKVSRSSLESSALRWSVKDYLFKALLCHLAIHAPSHKLAPVAAKLDAYVDMCPSMDNTREKELIGDLMADFDAQDADAFADHVFRYDEIAPLDRWKSKVLLEIKKALEGGNPEEGEIGV